MAVLPVLDDFERAFKDESDDPKAIREGMKMIYKKFEKALESLGVKKIDTKEKDFDTDFHEAVAMVLDRLMTKRERSSTVCRPVTCSTTR